MKERKKMITWSRLEGIGNNRPFKLLVIATKIKSKSNKHKLEKRKKNRDERRREELTSERKKSHGEGVVARNAAERERERELVVVC